MLSVLCTVDWPAVVGVVKDVVVAIAAGVTAMAAYFGLKNWSRELHGKTEFEVARTLIRSTYRVRDEMQGCRSPFVLSAEFPPEYPGQLHATPEQEAKGWNFVYANRWAPVRDAVREFDVFVLEAEVLWGHEIRTKTDLLLQRARELQVAMEAVVDDKAERGENFRLDREFGMRMRSIVSGSRTDEDNPFNRGITDAVKAIEAVVLPHLRRG